MKAALLFLLLALTPCLAAEPAASPEKVTADLFRFLIANQRQLTQEPKLEERWLSSNLRKVVADRTRWVRQARATHPKEVSDDDPQPPDNGTFLAAWDFPTSFRILKTTTTPRGAVVQLRCLWGPGTQYAGDQRLMSVELVQEGGAWRVADIQSHKGKFNAESRLSEELKTRM